MQAKWIPKFVAIGWCFLPVTLSAQWVTESYPLEAGWNAIWLSHDTAHDTIDNLLAGHVAIEEVWRWNPAASTTQFTTSPSVPVQADTQWLVWKRGFPIDTTMTLFGANAAYLVKVADGASNFTLQLTGKPVPPNYRWASSGLNFFGFPMRTPDSVAERNFETFLSHSNELTAGPDIFKYVGGPITNNPVKVNAPLLEVVRRGRAYWLRSTQFTDYYGPLRILVSRAGLEFGDTGSVVSLRVENVTAVAITATFTQAASSPAPAGSDALAGAVPLRVRGAFDPLTGQYSYSDFNAATDYVLGAGETKEMVFAVDRPTMAGSPGDVFQSILQVTDSLNISRIDLPVRAVTTSRAGLWVGAALVSTVDQITAAPAPLGDGTASVDVTTEADASVPKEFPLRLILHRNDAGQVTLLQRVHVGEDSGGTVIATADEALLDPAKVSGARRISSSHWPLGTKLAVGGDLGITGTVTFNSTLPHTAATNPFVHSYHPDHDNKDAQFSPTVLPSGEESPTVARAVTLAFTGDPSSLGLSDLGWGSTTLGGNYSETLTGLRAQPITVKGTFVLYRITNIPTLTE